MNEDEQYEVALITLRIKWDANAPDIPPPDKWDWDELLDLHANEEVEIVKYEVVTDGGADH